MGSLLTVSGGTVFETVLFHSKRKHLLQTFLKMGKGFGSIDLKRQNTDGSFLFPGGSLHNPETENHENQ